MATHKGHKSQSKMINLETPERGFVSTTVAKNWEEALIGGNGKIGTLVISHPVEETIIFSHERLSMPWFAILPLVDLSGHIDSLVGQIRIWRATNMTPTHDPGHVFHMDAAGGLPAVIIKMLVISDIGRIDLLSSLPKEWPVGAIDSVLCHGQMEIKQLSWDHAQICTHLVSEIPQKVKIRVPRGFTLTRINERYSVLIEPFDNETIYTVALPHAELVVLNFECH